MQANDLSGLAEQCVGTLNNEIVIMLSKLPHSVPSAWSAAMGVHEGRRNTQHTDCSS